MTNFEMAVLEACKKFIAHYDGKHVSDADDSVRTQNTATSNGIPICPVHDKIMRKGQYGYFCTTKENDPDLANDKGYCKHKVKG